MPQTSYKIVVEPDVRGIPNMQFLHCKHYPVMSCRSVAGDALLMS